MRCYLCGKPVTVAMDFMDYYVQLCEECAEKSSCHTCPKIEITYYENGNASYVCDRPCFNRNDELEVILKGKK